MSRDRTPPRRVPLRDSMVRLRWERLGRIALLVVFAAVIGLYAEHTISYFATRAENARQSAVVDGYRRQIEGLRAQQRSLEDPATIIRLARGLGMVRSGEQPFVVTPPGR